MNDHYVPSQQELIDAIRVELAFLVDTYGFREVTHQTEQHINPYSVLYRKNQISVLVEGVSYGFSTDCQIIVEMDSPRRVSENINLGYLMMLRTPHLLEPTYPEKRGQLTQLPRLAEGIRTAALDIITGDLSRLEDIKQFITKEQEKAKSEYRQREIARIDAKSQEAFHNGNYQEVIDLLSPLEAELSSATRKRLELAHRRLKS